MLLYLTLACSFESVAWFIANMFRILIEFFYILNDLLNIVCDGITTNNLKNVTTRLAHKCLFNMFECFLHFKVYIKVNLIRIDRFALNSVGEMRTFCQYCIVYFVTNLMTKCCGYSPYDVIYFDTICKLTLAWLRHMFVICRLIIHF